MEDILTNVCGLDVHKETVVACIIKNKPTFGPVTDPSKATVTTEIRTYSTLYDDLQKLRLWLEAEKCHDIAMESTGIYWHPIYDVLETAYDGDINLLVVNARHMKNVPGKKTDVKDAEWIASLLRAGLLRGSFIPPEEIRQLRQLTRYRKTIVEDICAQKNRIEKFLQSSGYKLSNFLTDIFGVSGRSLINILINKGKITPRDVELELRGNAKHKIKDMRSALNGVMNDHQRQFLALQLEHLDSLISHQKKVEGDIDALSSQFSSEIDLLTTIPGIGQTAAKAIIAEIGVDMSRFPTADHFTKWAGLSPGDNESAGKKKSTRITFGNTYVKGLICECAWCMVRSRNTYLSQFYWRLKARRGAKKAIIAVARKMLVIVYIMLSNGIPYSEEQFEKARNKQDEMRVRKIIKDAARLGLKVTKAQDIA